MRVGILTVRDFRGTSSGSSRLRGDWWVKYGAPTLELLRPRRPLDQYQAIVFQKAYDWALMRRFRGLKIFDCCDLEPEARKAARLCDVVTTSTRALAVEFAALRPTYCIPDRHDLQCFRVRRTPRPGPAMLAVWFGYWNNVEPLRPFVPVLERLGVRLRIYVDWPEGVRLDYADTRRWPLAARDPDMSPFNRELLEADIVLNPAKNRYTSDNKTTQAWLLNLPVARTPAELRRLHRGPREVVVDRDQYDVRRSVDELLAIVRRHLAARDHPGAAGASRRRRAHPVDTASAMGSMRRSPRTSARGSAMPSRRATQRAVSS